VAHHFRKSKPIGEPCDLADLSQAGCAEFAGQWTLLNRSEPYDEEKPGEHHLVMTLGSRVGYSSKWFLTIEEGSLDSPRGRYWAPEVLSPTEGRVKQRDAKEIEREARRQAQLEEDKLKILKVIAKYPTGESKSLIRDSSGLYSNRFGQALAALIDDDAVEPCDIIKGNKIHPQPGYKLTIE